MVTRKELKTAAVVMDRRTYKTLMSTESNSSSDGIGFIGLLTIVFITLKLLGYIEWSWLWVLSPIWITGSLVISFLVITIGFLAIWGRK